MDSSTKLRRSPDVLQADVDDQPVLLHSASWQYLQFEGTGGDIWNMLEQPMSIDMLVPVLRGRFSVDEETCRHETEKLVQILLDQKFLIAED